MPEPDVATLTHRLAALTRRKVGERMAHESWAHEAGFRPGCIGVLHVVAAREPVSQREVSEALMLDPSDLVTLVDILERAGLVERRRDPADRRRYALEVTPRGQLAVVRLREINRETNEELLAPLDEEERAQLAHLIGRVVRHHLGTLLPEPEPEPEPAPEPEPEPAPAAAAAAAAGPGPTTETETQNPERVGPAEHPEGAPHPYDPNREAARARQGSAAGSVRP